MSHSAPPPEDVTTPSHTCPDCGANADSSHHHAECIAPLDQIEGDN